MFPIAPSFTYAHDTHGDRFERERTPKPPSRLDVQRHHLEHKNMHNIDIMTLEQKSLDRDRDMRNRQLITEARGDRPSLTSKVRQSIGHALIAMGERIRPEFSPGETTFDA